jgi:hypothetical protein
MAASKPVIFLFPASRELASVRL